MTDTFNVSIQREPRTYTIHVGENLLKSIAQFVKESKRSPVVITDDNVNHHHGDDLEKALGMPLLIRLPPGEATKSRKTKQAIEEMLHDRHYGRDTIIIALGGGMIGDLAGFVAATFMRGIPFIQVPTSLLAMVDASIGGKTGVNTRHGKNLVGAMWQPRAVFTDTNYLKTLPEDEFLNGLAELVKIAATSDKEFFDFLESHTQSILDRDPKILSEVIQRGIKLKKEIVEQDAREKGPRQVLNFGHTIGHAIEADAKFGLKHGFCVAIGMATEARIAGMLGKLTEEEEKRFVGLLKKLRLPTTIPDTVTIENLFSYMKSDKKSKNSIPRFVLLNEIGTIQVKGDTYSFEIDEIVIKQALGECTDE